MNTVNERNLKDQHISRKHYFGLLAVVLIAFSFGVWFWLRTNTPGSQGGDAHQYNRLAVSLLEQGSLDYSSESIVVPPLYPAFLALIYLIAGEPSFVAASIANIALFAFGAGLVGWACMRLFSPAAGYFAGIMIFVNHDLLFWSPFALSEMLNIVFFILFALALKAFALKLQNRWLIIAGVFAALANLTHASLMIYLPAVLLWFLFNHPGTIFVRLSRAVIFCVVLLILVMPWSSWISSNRDATVPVADYGFLTLHHGNNPEYHQALKDYLFGDSNTPRGEGYSLPNLTDRERLNEIWNYISTSPLDWFQLYLTKLYYHLQFYNMKDISSLKVAIWSTGYWFLVWPLAIIYLVKNKLAWRDILVWLIATNLFLYPLIHISRYHRYRIPIEPLIVLLAAGGFSLMLPYITNYISPIWVKVKDSFGSSE